VRRHFAPELVNRLERIIPGSASAPMTRSSRSWPRRSHPGSSKRPVGSTTLAANSTSTSPAPATASTCRWTGACPGASARRCCGS
jgi:hypothetical protein